MELTRAVKSTPARTLLR